MVEFAIVVPFLVLLVVGICEIGYAFYHQNILNKSVQDGARFFSNASIARAINGSTGYLIDPINVSSTNSNNITKMQNLVIYGSTSNTGNPLMPNLASYTPAPTVYCAEENLANKVCVKDTTLHIRVTTSYQHSFILGSTFSGLLNLVGKSTANSATSYTLTASSVLRVE